MSFLQTREDMAALFKKWETDISTDKNGQIRMKNEHDYLLQMYDRFGHKYFTPLQWIILSFDRNKLSKWLEWAQEAEGDYIL